MCTYTKKQFKQNELTLTRYSRKSCSVCEKFIVKQMTQAVENKELALIERLVVVSVLMRKQLAKSLSRSEFYDTANIVCKFKVASNSSKALKNNDLHDITNVFHCSIVDMLEVKKTRNLLSVFDLVTELNEKFTRKSSTRKVKQNKLVSIQHAKFVSVLYKKEAKLVKAIDKRFAVKR